MKYNFNFNLDDLKTIIDIVNGIVKFLNEISPVINKFVNNFVKPALQKFTEFIKELKKKKRFIIIKNIFPQFNIQYT